MIEKLRTQQVLFFSLFYIYAVHVVNGSNLWRGPFQSGETEQIPIMLVGNKSDEESCREVDASICESLSKQWQCGYMETSAKNNTNVKELFQVSCRNVRRSRNNRTELSGYKLFSFSACNCISIW